MKFVDKEMQEDFDKIPVEVKEAYRKHFIQRIELRKWIEELICLTNKKTK